MNVRKFEPKDFDSARDLVASGDMVELPSFDDLGGFGVVLEHDLKIIGFVWALVAKDSNVAFVDYFTVANEHRPSGIAAVMLMTKMMLELATLGITRVVGLIKTNAYKADALARIYHSFGLDVAPSYAVMGDVSVIAKNLTERLKNGFIKTNDNHPKA